MRLLALLLLLGAVAALPSSKAGADPDDLVKNSWSARSVEGRDADADEQFKNSWSTRSIGNDVKAVVERKWAARDIEDGAPDADEVVKNSWSA